MAQVPSAVYDVAEVPGGATYSVVDKRGKVEPSPDEYNVLVHNGDQCKQPPTEVQKDGYSKLQM